MNTREIQDELTRIGSTLRNDAGLTKAVMDRVSRTSLRVPAHPQLRRLAMRLSIGTAAGLVAAAFVIAFLTTEPTYGLDQTGAALQKIRFIHIKMRDEKKGIRDERWIEITPEGRQGRYWQSGGSRSARIEVTIADDGKTCAVRSDHENRVFLYDSIPGGRFQWIGDLKGFLRDLSGKGDPGHAKIRRNVTYKGRQAHHVSLVRHGLDCYIDPKTNLPFAVGSYEVAFGQPPKGIFKLEIPKGAKVVDQRGKADPVMPKWMGGGKGQELNKTFLSARKALAEKEYAKAVKLFRQVVQTQPQRNWAWYWLGRAYEGLGGHKEAIEAYTKVIDMFAQLKLKPVYCFYSRGLAHAKLGRKDKAKRDLAVALPVMIAALRNPAEARMFEYADDPVNRGRTKGTEAANRARIVANMIGRLRAATGKEFGFDPKANLKQNEPALKAWKKWWAEHAAEHGASLERWKPYSEPTIQPGPQTKRPQ